jgi:magnesium transporter
MAIPPGSSAPTIRLCRYAADRVDEQTVEGAPSPAQLAPAGDEVLWIDVHGLGDEQRLRSIAAALGIPEMALADVVNAPQRDKVETLPDQLFVVAHQVWLDPDEGLRSGQASLFLGDGYVATFHDGPEDLFQPVRQRVRHPRSRLSHRGADYLLYALLDTLIDHYFPALEQLGAAIEELQDEVFNAPAADHQEELFALRRDLMTVRRRVWPLREVASSLVRDDSDRLDEVAEQHLRDCFDHVSVLVEMVDSQRELLASLADAHMAGVSQHMNQVMKVLTMIATVFIPLSFLAGVFGMNFVREGRPWNMPELGWAFGYPAFWAVCLVVAGVMLWLFRRNHWL